MEILAAAGLQQSLNLLMRADAAQQGLNQAMMSQIGGEVARAYAAAEFANPGATATNHASMASEASRAEATQLDRLFTQAGKPGDNIWQQAAGQPLHAEATSPLWTGTRETNNSDTNPWREEDKDQDKRRQKSHHDDDENDESADSQDQQQHQDQHEGHNQQQPNAERSPAERAACPINLAIWQGFQLMLQNYAENECQHVYIAIFDKPPGLVANGQCDRFAVAIPLDGDWWLAGRAFALSFAAKFDPHVCELSRATDVHRDSDCIDLLVDATQWVNSDAQNPIEVCRWQHGQTEMSGVGKRIGNLLLDVAPHYRLTTASG